jgi:hypothetical protein
MFSLESAIPGAAPPITANTLVHTADVISRNQTIRNLRSQVQGHDGLLFQLNPSGTTP